MASHSRNYIRLRGRSVFSNARGRGGVGASLHISAAENLTSVSTWMLTRLIIGRRVAALSTRTRLGASFLALQRPSRRRFANSFEKVEIALSKRPSRCGFLR